MGWTDRIDGLITKYTTHPGNTTSVTSESKLIWSYFIWWCKSKRFTKPTVTVKESCTWIPLVHIFYWLHFTTKHKSAFCILSCILSTYFCNNFVQLQIKLLNLFKNFKLDGISILKIQPGWDFNVTGFKKTV